MKDFICRNKHYFVSKNDVKGYTYNCLREGGDSIDFPEVDNAKAILIEFIENNIKTDDNGNILKPLIKTVCGVNISPTTHELIRVVLKMER